MHPSLVVVSALALISTPAYADLTCLAWDPLILVVGLICHFKPELYKEAEKTAVSFINSTIHSVEDLVKFDLIHNPAAVTYDYVKTAETEGLSQANSDIAKKAKDFGGVTIGFGKETTNQLVQLYNLLDWSDVSACIINGASGSPELHQHYKRAPSPADAVRIGQRCIAKKLNKPAVFNVTDDDEKVGATISDIAAFLVPVGLEGETATGVSSAVDLAVPGSESSSRIFKAVDSSTAGEHFSDLHEAEGVKEGIKDSEWRDSNCRVCSAPPVGTAKRRSIRHGHSRRGIGASICCYVPSDVSAGLRLDAPDNPYGSKINPAFSGPGDSQLKDPPRLEFHERPQNLAEVKPIVNDLRLHNTAVIKASPALVKIMSFDELFFKLREAFTQPTTNPLYELLGIQEEKRYSRLTFTSLDILGKSDPRLEVYKNWVEQQSKDALHLAVAMGKLNSKYLERDPHMVTEFFYSPPSERPPASGFTALGYHQDGGILSLGAQEYPGLVIENSLDGTASRVTPVKDGFYLLKGSSWKPQKQGPTRHAVFGSKMAEEGRVSVVTTVRVW